MGKFDHIVIKKAEGLVPAPFALEVEMSKERAEHFRLFWGLMKIRLPRKLKKRLKKA